MPHRLPLSRRFLVSSTPQPHKSLIPNHFFIDRTSFHTSSTKQASLSEENHYTALESTPQATSAQLKKQFYALSKRYHPDLHPNDPSASQRFVRISTAWATLSNESKKAQYDRDLMRSDPAAFGLGSNSSSHYGSSTGTGAVPTGSHSSAQAAYGARPASGLSKRRSQFKGPPPSFYKSGGWGNQEGKRRAAAEGAEEAARRAAEESVRGGAGFSPGQGQSHADFEVPHFDRDEHFRRQENVEEQLRRRRAIWAERERMERAAEQSGLMGRVIIVSGALITTGIGIKIWEKTKPGKTKA